MSHHRALPSGSFNFPEFSSSLYLALGDLLTYLINICFLLLLYLPILFHTLEVAIELYMFSNSTYLK